MIRCRRLAVAPFAVLLLAFGSGIAGEGEPAIGAHVEILMEDGALIAGTVRHVQPGHWHIEQRRQGTHGTVAILVMVPLQSMLGWQADQQMQLQLVFRQAIDGRDDRRYVARTVSVADVPQIVIEEAGL